MVDLESYTFSVKGDILKRFKLEEEKIDEDKCVYLFFFLMANGFEQLFQFNVFFWEIILI